MTEELKFYKPTISKEDPLSLSREELAYAPKLLEASQDGLIKVKLEEDVIIQRVSHDLYANPESGFRELYNNEARACRIAGKHFEANPTIEITLIPSERKLVIHGIDSLGISQEKFVQLYAVLGRSDNWDSGEVGQWGIGKASYTTLSDIMILETLSREDETRYAVLGKSGIGYNLLPEPTDLKEHGTRITITLRQDVRVEQLLAYITKCTKFSGIETYLNLAEDVTESYYGDDETPKKVGRYRLGPEKFDEYLKSIIEKSRRYENLLEYIPVNVEDDDFSLRAAIVVRKDYDGGRVRNAGSEFHQTYLLGTPIESHSLELPFSGWLLNIKDERLYQPTADRERLSDKAEQKVTERMKPRLRESLSFLEARTIDEYLSSEYQDVIRDYEKLGLRDYLSAETTDLCDFVNVEVKVLGSREKLSVSGLLKQSRNLFYLPTLNENKAFLIQSRVPGAVVFKLPRRRDEDQYLELMLRHGVTLADQFIRENALKLPKQEKPIGDVVVHLSGEGWYSWGRFKCVARHAERIDPEDLDEKTVRVPRGRMTPYLGLLSAVKTNYKLAMDDGRLSNGVALREFVKNLGSRRAQTNCGFLSFEEVATSRRTTKIGLYSDPSLARHYRGNKNLMIFGDEGLTFELAAFLTYHGVEYSIDASGHDAFQEEYPERHYHASEFIHDSGYEKLGDAEVLYSVIHADKGIEDNQLKGIFLNAVRHSRDSVEVRKMREYVLLVNDLMEAHRDESAGRKKGSSHNPE